ncbi:Hypothetical protein OINT_2001229 [Brucella intermedia LMG 3301]|uniref:Uncharacterized protein n=1 Tax=Brucella intermedia LMG 3301 TaxID=641118 RepID=C4WNV1_9HYPH|nr:Hypothetical protein OINT_2001229 [Brucella intermedia LMG 3301]MBA8843553.1 hypothetical protein [Ochrobactrum sp. RH1CCR137]MBA8857932.1 hypothetical protein [Ochrobactrum sp. RH1CCR134]
MANELDDGTHETRREELGVTSARNVLPCLRRKQSITR